MTKAATPWGPAELVEELKLVQAAGGKRFSSFVQLLEAPGGGPSTCGLVIWSGCARASPTGRGSRRHSG